MDYLQQPEEDEKHEISILRKAWWEFQIFRLQQPPGQTPKEPENRTDFLELPSESSRDLREDLCTSNQIVTGTGLLWILGFIFWNVGPLK